MGDPVAGDDRAGGVDGLVGAERNAIMNDLLPADDTVVNCVRFVKWALQEGPWSGGDLDGGGIQDKAESLGLIVSVPYDPEKHGADNDYGCDAGDPWFEFSPGLVTSAQQPTLDRLRRCITMAMGCLDAESENPDERLAWLRLSDGMEGREPRASLTPTDNSGAK